MTVSLYMCVTLHVRKSVGISEYMCKSQYMESGNT
jgi:hypothetical protein